MQVEVDLISCRSIPKGDLLQSHGRFVFVYVHFAPIVVLFLFLGLKYGLGL
jgi:hypothetical protein